MLVSDVLVLTSPGRVDAAAAIAACRAGACGALDLEYAADADQAREQIVRFAQFTTGALGIKIAPSGLLSVEQLLELTSGRLGWVLLAGGEIPALPTWIEQFKAAGVEVLCEAVSADEARWAIEFGATGIVLKGSEASGRIGNLTAGELVQTWGQLATSTGLDVPYWVQGGIGLRTAAACQVAGTRGVVLDDQLLLARESQLSDAARHRLEACDGTETQVLGTALGAGYRLHNEPGSRALAELEAALAEIEKGSLPASERAAAWRVAVRRVVINHAGEELLLLGQDAALANSLATSCATVGGIVQQVAAECERNLATARRLNPLAAGAPLAVEQQTRYPLVQSPLPGATATVEFAQAVAAEGALPILALDKLRKADVTKLLKDAAGRIPESPWGVGLDARVAAEVFDEQMAATLAACPKFALLAGGRFDQAKHLEKRGIATYLEVASPEILRQSLRDGARRFVFADRDTTVASSAPSTFLLWETLCDAVLEYIGTSQRGSELSIVLSGGVHDAVSAAMATVVASSLAERGVRVGASLCGAYHSTSAAVVANGKKNGRATHDAIDIAQLHASVCEGSNQLLEELELELAEQPAAEPPCDIAVIGMSCFYPGATSLNAYWENILAKKVEVREIPATHWDWELYYDADPMAKDKIVSKWGGFLSDINFDPLRYGITPASMKSIEPLQLLLLEAVRHALTDAGYDRRPFNRDRTAAVVGIGGGGSPMATAYGFRTCMRLIDNVPDAPVSSDAVLDSCEQVLPEWTEDSFPGFLFNVAVGRVANRFNLGGPNYAIDAACASSLAALQAAVRELTIGTSDMAIAMGADTVQTPFAYMAFSKTYALSRKGRSRPFDAEADGIVLSEGIGVLVLKRLADAQRDGDRIYAVIKGVGSSSDGKEKGLTAPNATGQKRALARAYAQAQIAPATVRLIEAHGTGTVVGDRTEAESMASVLLAAGAAPRSCAVGSVKSLIGHAKCAAGLAGMIKGILSLDRKVLPPTLVETPNSAVQFADSPLYLNTEPRPWIQSDDEPRRAGVSAFGFGGTNFHVVLEEYRGDYLREKPLASEHWPAELLVFRRRNREELTAAIRECQQALAAGAKPALHELAASIWNSNPERAELPIVAIVANSLDDLQSKLSTIENVLQGKEATYRDPRGCYFAERPADAAGQIALVFPGQGSQYANMLADVAMAFADAREELDRAEALLAGKLPRPLGSYLYPPSAFDDTQRAANERALADATVAQPAIAAASLAMLRVLRRLGLKVDFAAGHSFGEYVALTSADALDSASLYNIALRRGELIAAAAAKGQGGMVAVAAAPKVTEQLLEGLADAWIANQNSPQQTVVAGTDTALTTLVQRCQQHKLRAARLPVACGFHSPLLADATTALGEVLAAQNWSTPRQTVFANTTGQAYTGSSSEIVDQLTKHLSSPVRFQDEIEALYAAGARTFVEVGPHNVLTGLIGSILGDRPHVALATDMRGRSGLVQLAHTIGQLLVHGVDLHVEELYAGRVTNEFDLASLSRQTGETSHSPMTWLVNGVRCRPIDGPEPSLLGQRLRPKDGGPIANAPGHGRATELKHAERFSMKSAIPAPPAPVSQNGNAIPHTNGNAVPHTNGNGHGHSNGHFWSAPAAAAPAPVASAPTPAPTPIAPPVNGTHYTTPLAPTAPSTNGAHTAHLVPSAAPVSPIATDAATQVVLRYQDLMERFLESQRSVMLAYLQVGAPAISVEPVTPVTAPATSTSSMALPAAVAPPAPSTFAAPPIALAPVSQNGAAYWQSPSHDSVPAPAAAPVVAPVAAPAVQAPAIAQAPVAQPETPTATTEVTAAALTSLDFDQIQNRLLELVSKRTGYPIAMLDLDLDLEGELGIDSIKRVEILSGLAESLTNISSDLESKIVLEKLTVIRTLGGIIDYLKTALADDDDAEADAEHDDLADEADNLADAEDREPALVAEATSTPTAELEVQRTIVQLTDAPLPADAELIAPAGTVIITDDGRGIAKGLVRKLQELEIKSALVQQAAGAAATFKAGVLQGDLTDADTVEKLLALAGKKLGPIAGLVHLLPLAAASPETAPADRAYAETKSLYLIARQLEASLRALADKGGNPLLLTVTGLGGGLGFADPAAHPLPDDYFGGHGGVVGLAKCIAQEWNGVLVRVVDVDPALAPAQIVEHLTTEMGDRRGPAEIGYLDGNRVTWQLAQETLEATSPADPAPLTEGAKILVTGGARGITAAIAIELARRFRPTLILVGRSPLPPAEEESHTIGLREPGELKAALIKHLSNGKPPRPAEVEKAYQRLLQEREIRDNLASMRAAGATVEYYSVDVRDEQALERLIADVRARHGHLDGVLHGAGVIEDKLLRDKTPESFDRVFRTKVDSAFALCRLLKLDELKFLVFFASLASRYGNRGQSDYAAANEVLSKLAVQLDRQLPARVFSVAWGPWAEVGMVAELEPHLTRRGLKLISPATGPAFLIDELLLGRKGTAEIVVAGGAERLVAPVEATG